MSDVNKNYRLYAKLRNAIDRDLMFSDRFYSVVKDCPKSLGYDEYTRELLWNAVRYGQLDVVKFLVSRMSPEAINYIDSDGMTVLTLAARRLDSQMCKILIPLMSAKAISSINSLDNTALSVFVRLGINAVCEQLIYRMSLKSIKSVDNDGMSALDWAARNKMDAVCHLLSMRYQEDNILGSKLNE